MGLIVVMVTTDHKVDFVVSCSSMACRSVFWKTEVNWLSVKSQSTRLNHCVRSARVCNGWVGVAYLAICLFSHNCGWNVEMFLLLSFWRQTRRTCGNAHVITSNFSVSNVSLMLDKMQQLFFCCSTTVIFFNNEQSKVLIVVARIYFCSWRLKE